MQQLISEAVIEDGVPDNQEDRAAQVLAKEDDSYARGDLVEGNKVLDVNEWLEMAGNDLVNGRVSDRLGHKNNEEGKRRRKKLTPEAPRPQPTPYRIR